MVEWYSCFFPFVFIAIAFVTMSNYDTITTIDIKFLKETLEVLFKPLVVIHMWDCREEVVLSRAIKRRYPGLRRVLGISGADTPLACLVRGF